MTTTRQETTRHEAALAASPTDVLLRSYAALTRRMERSVTVAAEVEHRQMRDLVHAEIIRRAGGA